MKLSNLRLLAILCLSFEFSTVVFAQVTGSFRTNGVGTDWTTAANWDRWSGAAWVAGVGYPGQAAALPGTTVTIQNGHTINIAAAIPNSIVNLAIGGGTSGTLTVGQNTDASYTLTCTGTVVVAAGAVLQSGGNTGGTHTLNFQSSLTNSGTINNAAGTDQISITVSGNTINAGTITFALNNGTKIFVGLITNSGFWTSTAITTNGNLVFRGGITNSGTFSAGAGDFNTTAAQTLSGNTLSFANYVNVATPTVVTNNGTVSLTRVSGGGSTLTGTGTWTQGVNGTLNYTGDDMSGITTFNATNSGNTVNYNGTAAQTIRATSYQNFTYSGSSSATVATGTTVNIAGNLTCSSGTLSGTGTGTFVFNGASTQTISGAGTFNFTNFTLNTTSAANVAVNNSITISGALTWSANGLLVLGSNANLTLTSAATLVGGSTAVRYIQLDGSTGSNSNLIKTTAAATAGATSWAITYPIGTSAGGYTPITIPTLTNNPTANSTLSVKAIYNASNQGQLRRVFRMTVAGNAGTTFFTNGAFNYNNTSDISSGDAESNYTTEWYLSTANGSWQNIATIAAPTNIFTVAGGSAATASLATGTYYYTIGQSTAYPNTWYSYQTGVWSNWQNWTLDPSGSSLVNGLNLPPQPGDEVVILNGLTITNDVSNQVASTTTINAGGTLDMVATTGNTLGTVSGSGLLRIQGVALPTGTYTAFVASTGGTIEYYNTGGTLPTTQTTYNKLMFTNSTGSNITYIMASNLTVNSTFDIQATGSGTVTWQINNATNTQRTITLNGNLTVGTNGGIQVGTGNNAATTPHTLTLLGNFINNGTVKFYDQTDALLSAATYGNVNAVTNNLYTAALRGNAVTATFSGVTDNTITCNGTTDFYRLVLNKGTGQQAILTVNSSNTNNFRLWGPTNSNSIGTAPNEYSNTSLSIINGTLQLTGSINIPNLVLTPAANNEYFSIPQNGALWLNGAGVTVTVTENTLANDNLGRRLMLSGLLRITDGFLDAGNGAGISSEDGASYLQEGGTVRCFQFRPRSAGTQIFSFNMTGGTLNVGYGYSNVTPRIAYTNAAYSRIDLGSTTCTFQMSGGIINVAKPVNGTGLLDIGSSAANYNVTNGTINFYTGLEDATNSYSGLIRSTAPLYNITINEETATTQAAVLSANLTVLNNVNIVTGNAPVFNTGNFNLTVGGNFTINSATTYTPGTGTTTFNGTGAQTWTHSGTITALASVVMNKTAGTLTLAGSATFPNITTALTLTAGTMANGGKNLTLTGTAALSNSATHTGTGVIDYQSSTATIGGSGGVFSNLTITQNATIATSGGQTVTGTLRLIGANTSLNIGSNALTALGNIYSDGATGVAFTANKRIITSGLHNAGGLTRQGSASDVLFPIGSSAVSPNPAIGYTPVTINVTATTQGTLTVRPVNSEHPNVTTTAQGIRYYWRVTSSGYSGITVVTHKTYNYSTATEDNASANYRAARYDRTANSWATNNTVFNATASPPIPNFNTGTGWTGISGDQLDGEYTCGNIAAFGAVTTYYSRAPGNWTTNATWSTDGVLKHTGAAAGSTPCAQCPVVIGDGASNNHSVTTTANTSCGSLTLSAGSTLDCSTFTGHNFGTSTGGTVSGTGTLRINANVFPAGDFTNFIGPNGGTVEYYGATKTIPATGPAPQSLSLSTYYNLVINPTSSTITLPTSSLTIYNNWTQGSSGSGTVVTNGATTINIAGNMTVTAGTFNFSNAAASAVTLVVGGSISNSSTAGIFSVAAGGTANTHTLTVSGGITNNGTMNFAPAASGVVNITFTGNNDVNFTGSGTGGTTLNLVTVNKGTSVVPTVTFDVSGTVTNTARALGWLTLTNGTFYFNNSQTYNISNSSYTIPPTARLRVGAGTVNIITTDADANDLFLNGTLQISGGAVNVGTTTVDTNNSDIEYGSAGNPTLNVSGGSLWVKSAIRRSTTTIAGALVYNQTGGTITVGGIDCNTTPNFRRGVFEIDANPGSSFTMTGSSSLIVQRTNGGTQSYADLFINPITSNVSSGSTISIGLNGAAQALRANISPTIGNFTVVGGGTAQTVTLFSNPMVVGGNLTITSPSVLVTNNLDVTIAGDLAITGTGVYTGGTNTTTFNGTGAQAGSLTAGSTFTNMTVNKTGGTTLSLSGTAPSLTNLNILNGILNVGALALTVSGNITNNSSQVGSGSITITGTATTHTISSSNGSFTNLSLGGTSTTKVVSVTGNMSVLGTLDFTASGTSRYLFIGANQLTLGSSSTVSNAGTSRFVRTNGVSSDLGVLRNFAAGTVTFTYPVGTRTNYTPVTLNTFVVTTPGSLTVLPVDDQHPTSNPTGEQLLSYYWSLTKNSTLIHNATGSVVFQIPSALIAGAGGTLIGAYLDAINLIGWTAGGALSGINPRLLTFTGTLNTFLPAVNGQFDYTFGTTNTLPNPVTPVYSRFADADGVSNPTTAGNSLVGASWASASSWTISATGNGAPLSSIPTNRPVVILPGARVNADLLGRRAFSTVINGLLVINTVGHNMGFLSGTGTMRTSTNTLPAGNYTTFTNAGGGTIEYIAPMTMNSRATYNNLSIFSGSTGTVTMTNTNLTVNGNLSIPTGTTLNNANNNNITIAGNWSNSGTFTQGTGTVTFNGSSAQTMSGSNTFTGLTINNTGNVALSGTGSTTVTGTLTLTNGNIVSSATNTLALGTSTVSGGSASSYIAGPVTKTINAAATFAAPLGSITPARYRPATIANTSGTDTWSFEYVPANPTTASYSNQVMNTANILTVSAFEYWQISRAGSTTADVTLTYGTGSYVPPDIGTLANVRVVRWDGTQWDLPPGGGTPTQLGSVTAGTVSITNVTNFSPLTLGSLDNNSPLPVTYLSFSGKIVPTGVELQWRTATEINNDYFAIEKSTTGENFISIGRVKGKGTSYAVNTYSFIDENPVTGKVYYRLRQTDFNGTFSYSNIIAMEYYANQELVIAFYPNPIQSNTNLTVDVSGLVGIASLPITIADQLGKVHAIGSLSVSAEGKASQQVSLEHLPNGVYLISIGNSNKIVKRIVIAR